MLSELLERCEQWQSEGGIWSCWVSKLIILSQFRVSESGTRKPLLRCLKLGCPTVPLAGDWPWRCQHGGFDSLIVYCHLGVEREQNEDWLHYHKYISGWSLISQLQEGGARPLQQNALVVQGTSGQGNGLLTNWENFCAPNTWSYYPGILNV